MSDASCPPSAVAAPNPEFEAIYRQRIADCVFGFVPESTHRALAVLDLVKEMVLRRDAGTATASSTEAAHG